jgi:Fe-S-cluster-containing hydrogenase component 2
LPAVRNLTLAYALAGADCIDIAADPAVIAAAQAGLLVASRLVGDAQARGFDFSGTLPLLMVSLNDGEDPHFRKAGFNSTTCPEDCSRPCEKVCPAQAIIFNDIKDGDSGVISQKCYGCGRCLPVCPYGIIYTTSSRTKPGAIAPLIMSTGLDALEIHTKVGRLAQFQELWQAIAPWADKLKVIAISCNDSAGLIRYLQAIYDLITPRPPILIWQTDGRSMSGDIGEGTTRATIKLGQKVLAARLPGYVQLAGGTNGYTVAKLEAMGLLNQRGDSPRGEHSVISGIAYGSYARVLLSPMLNQLENQEVSNSNNYGNLHLEDQPDLLWKAVELAHSLVSQLKPRQERRIAHSLSLKTSPWKA